MTIAEVENSALELDAPAKVNLYLRVLGRRDDGFHELQSLVVLLDWGDTVRLGLRGRREPGWQVSCRCPDHPELDGAGNLAHQAAQRFLTHLGPDADQGGELDLELVKRIPAASGLGGGAADAAATLRGLHQLVDPARPLPDLLDLAASVGSDVPVCLLGRPAWMGGRGERVQAVDSLPEMAICLVTPPIRLTTVQAFGALLQPLFTREAPPFPETPTTIAEVAALIHNDFWPVVGRVCPEVIDLARRLHREAPLAVGLSGTGPALFGLYADADAARGAARQLAQDGLPVRVCLPRTAHTPFPDAAI